MGAQTRRPENLSPIQPPKRSPISTMKGDPEFVILKHSTWLDAFKYETQILGSIVRQPLKPTNDYIPSNPLQYNSFDLVEPTEPMTDFALENTNTDAKHARATLASIANFEFRGQVSESVKLAGKTITFKKLQQRGEFWKKIKADKVVSQKLPAWIHDSKGWPPCLVMGIMIAEDVELDFAGAADRSKDGNVELPIGKIATAAMGAPMPMNLGNMSADAGTSHGSSKEFKAKAPKRSIFALELQTVSLAKSSRFWSSKRGLSLQDDGPEFEEGRLMGENEDDSDADDLPSVDDLELVGFSDVEYARMSG
jgi:hypothetical protein